MVGVKKMIKAFLSHTGSDKDLVGRVQERLTHANSWYDAVDIENGESIPEKINEGLRNATHYILFWSEKASKSPWVKAELNAAFVRMLACECKFMIFTLDDTKLPELLQPYKYDKIDNSDLDEAAKIISEKALAQEGPKSKLAEFVNRTDELGEIEKAVRNGYKLIILNGILGIGKSSLADRAIEWLYTNRAKRKIVIDFNMIPGVAELSLELSRLTKQHLINDNLSLDKQRENIRFFFEHISESNIIMVLKDVKKWLDEDGLLNADLQFITDLIVDTEMFEYATFMTTSRYIKIPYNYCIKTRQITIRGMDDACIAEIINANLPRSFQFNTEKNLEFAKRLYGYPLGAKLGAYQISNHGYDYYLNQPQKIQELKVGLAKHLISDADISDECSEYLKVVALTQSRLRNDEYAKAIPDLANNIAKLADEAFFAGILKFDDYGCYKLEPLVEDYFYDSSFNASNRKQLSDALEAFLLDEIKNVSNENYMRLVPVAVHILTLNKKISDALALRAELTATITSSMWDQYNHREYEEAIKTADGLLTTDEKNTEALYVKSLCLTRFDEYEKAESILDSLINIDAGNPARYYYALGRIQKRQGNYSKAIEYFQVAITKKRKYLSPYREMAECYIHMGKLCEAHSAIEKAKQVDDSNIFVILLEARLLQKENKADVALELLSNQSIMEQDPAQISFRKGRAYDQLGQKTEAKRCYEEALKYNSKTYDAKLCLLNHQILDNPEIAKKNINDLKSILRGKRRHILTNIEARFIGYQNHDEDKALEILNGVPESFRDKQWYAVRIQILENLIKKQTFAGRRILAQMHSTELSEIQECLFNRFGDETIVDADLIPDT